MSAATADSVGAGVDGASQKTRTVSVGISRLFRLVEIDGTIPVDYTPNLIYRVEQAVRNALTKKWEWKPLASTPDWHEGHGALHQMQADLWDRVKERRTNAIITR